MNWYPLLIFIHVLSASVFFMTTILMQLVFDNAFKRIPESSGKKEASLFIRKRFTPVVDTTIIIVGLTGFLLGVVNWEHIWKTPIVLLKASIGAVTLLGASANHFIFRGIKRKLIETGKSADLLQRINSVSRMMGRAALIGGSSTVLLGWYINYFGT